MRARTRRLRTTRIARLFLFLCLLPGSRGTRVAAQDTSARTLSLAEALALAEASSPTYRQADNDVSLNGVEMRATWLESLLPNADLTLFSTGFTGNRTLRATDDFGNPVERPESDWVYFSSTQQGLNLSWTLRGTSLFTTFRGQKLTNLGRVVARDRTLATVRIAVRRRYMAALREQALMRAEQGFVEARRLDLEVAQRLFSLAMKTRVDVLNAELDVQQQELALRQQESAFERAKLALRTELGDESLVSFDLQEVPLSVFDPGVLDGDRLVRTALEENPGLEESRIRVDAAQVGVSEARASWWPVLQMGMNVSRTAQTRGRDALFDVSFDEGLESRFIIQLAFPLFNDFFRNRQEDRRASVALDNRMEEDRAMRLRTRETVRSALLELSNQYRTLQLAERSAEIAAEALRLAREEYRIGTRTFAELRLSFDQDAATRRQVIQAQYDFVDAFLSLEEAVGVAVAVPGPDDEGR
ncbi:MAG: TolC family protein [Gemmatimonadota bacterium]|nr:TolC family protein [Gemmatimonadota bacterium]